MSYKVLRTIDVELSTESLNRAIREIQATKAALRQFLSELAEELTKQGADVAKMQVASMDAVDTGDLENSIYGYYDGGAHIGYIMAPSPHAFYVEYGTGVVAQASPHPEQGIRGIQYDVNGHGMAGWIYPSEDGWILGRDGKTYAWTRGMPARPFMYNTMRWLEEAAKTVASQILGQM